MLSLCGPQHKPPTRADIRDARAGKDPTKTYYLRARMRAQGDRRWQTLARTIRTALIQDDLLGQRGIGRLPHGDKTQGFATWLAEELNHKVFGFDGSWTRPFIRQAAETAQKHADVHVPGSQADQHRIESMQTLTISELEGIIAEAQRQITRVVTQAMMAAWSPTKTANAVTGEFGVIPTMRARTCAMSEWMIARTHALTTLSAFRNAGVQRVGIIPEKVRKIPTHDHVLDAEPEEVDVLTAGDDDVCIVCENISDDGPYDIDEAEGLIPAHPWCRCAFVPAGTLDDAAMEAAGIIFRTHGGNMLLMKRSDTGQWSIPAGHLEENESSRHAAHRESAEETGNPGNSQAYKVHETTHNGLRFHTYVQPAEWQFEPILNPEHTEYGWFSLGNLPEPLHPGLVATLHSMTEGGGKIASSS